RHVAGIVDRRGDVERFACGHALDSRREAGGWLLRDLGGWTRSAGPGRLDPVVRTFPSFAERGPLRFAPPRCSLPGTSARPPREASVGLLASAASLRLRCIWGHLRRDQWREEGGMGCCGA